MNRLCSVVLLLFTLCSSAVAGVDSLTNSESITGLKDALTQSSIAAVSKLGVVNGFLDNPKALCWYGKTGR